MQIATIVKQIVEVAAVNPEAQAIIVASVPDSQKAVLREALEALWVDGQLPCPVFLMSGEVALADDAGGGPPVGLFIGANQLVELLKITGEELKTTLSEWL